MQKIYLKLFQQWWHGQNKCFWYLEHLSSRYNLQLGFLKKFLMNSVCLRSDAFAMLPHRWGRSPTAGCQCCGSPAGFSHPSQELPCGCLGQSDSFQSLVLAWGRCLQWDIHFPVGFPPTFHSFFPLCILWDVPMEVKPLSLSPLLWWILPRYWQSLSEPRSAFWQPCGHSKAHPIPLCLLAGYQCSPGSTGSPGSLFLWLCWPRLPPWLQAGWARALLLLLLLPCGGSQLGTERPWLWGALLSTAPVPLLGHFGCLQLCRAVHMQITR